MAAGANLATTLSIILSCGYAGLYYKLYTKNSTVENKTIEGCKPERIRSIIKRLFIVALPITLSAIMSTLNKNVDSMTVIRFLKKLVTETEAKMQYGILSGKVDTLITLPLSFNVAFSTALVPAIAGAIAKKDTSNASKRISFSTNCSKVCLLIIVSTLP